ESGRVKNESIAFNIRFIRRNHSSRDRFNTRNRILYLGTIRPERSCILMIYNVVGLESKKVFFTGTRADCHKHLISGFPTFYEKDYEKRGGQVMIHKVLPEPMQIRRTR